MIDWSTVVFISIIAFGGGFLVGYLLGWDDGAQRGFSIGWRDAMQEVRRILARTKGAA